MGQTRVVIMEVVRNTELLSRLEGRANWKCLTEKRVPFPFTDNLAGGLLADDMPDCPG